MRNFFFSLQHHSLATFCKINLLKLAYNGTFYMPSDASSSCFLCCKNCESLIKNLHFNIYFLCCCFLFSCITSQFLLSLSLTRLLSTSLWKHFTANLSLSWNNRWYEKVLILRFFNLTNARLHFAELFHARINDENSIL